MGGGVRPGPGRHAHWVPVVSLSHMGGHGGLGLVLCLLWVSWTQVLMVAPVSYGFSIEEL